MTDNEYTAGTVATMATVPVVLLILAVIAAAAAVMVPRASSPRDRQALRWIAGAAAAVLVAVAALTWWGMYPWRAEYHEWRQVTGIIDDVAARRVAAGDKGATEDKYAVRFAGDARQYGVLDTRMANARRGDRLTITCVRQYQWAGTHGYDCQFVALAAR